jgi:hypothetical protein
MAASSPFQKASPQELFKRVSPSVVVVEVLDNKGSSVVAVGSGVVVGAGQIVTNRHVIDSGRIWRLRQGDKTWRAFVTWVDPDHDLGLLKAEGLSAPAVSLRVSPAVAVGERVYAIGTPEGLELTLSEGIVSGLREYEGSYVIQTSAPVSPGSSGGGLFDEEGQLVGITSFGLIEGQNLNFALATESVQALERLWTVVLSNRILTQLRKESGVQTPAEQQLTRESKEVFDHAETLLSNFESFIWRHRLLHYPDQPGPLHIGEAASWLRTGAVLGCIKNERSLDCSRNWPLWEQASLLMLMLRQQIQAAKPARDDFEAAFLDGPSPKTWSEVRDIYCEDHPAGFGFYTDLDGRIRKCP